MDPYDGTSPMLGFGGGGGGTDSAPRTPLPLTPAGDGSTAYQFDNPFYVPPTIGADSPPRSLSPPPMVFSQSLGSVTSQLNMPLYNPTFGTPGPFVAPSTPMALSLTVPPLSLNTLQELPIFTPNFPHAAASLPSPSMPGLLSPAAGLAIQTPSHGHSNHLSHSHDYCHSGSHGQDSTPHHNGHHHGHKRHHDEDYEPGSQVKSEPFTIPSFEAPIYVPNIPPLPGDRDRDYRPPSPTFTHTATNVYGHHEGVTHPTLTSSASSPSSLSLHVIRQSSLDSKPSASAASAVSTGSVEHIVIAVPPAKHHRHTPSPARQRNTDRNREFETPTSVAVSATVSPPPAGASPASNTRQRYKSLEERQLHRKQKHREMDALRRQKETAVVERFATLSGQHEEKLEEKRDRVTTLEVACDRYAELLDQFNRLKVHLAQSQERCTKLESQLSLTRGAAFDANFESMMATHELETATDARLREESLILSTTRAEPPPFTESASSHVRQQQLLDRMMHYYHSHTLYQAIIWNSSMMLMVVSLTTARFLDCSQTFLDRSGWTRPQIIGKVFHGVWSVLSSFLPNLPSVHYDFDDRPPMRTKEGRVVPAPFFSDQLAHTKKAIASLYRGEQQSVSCVFRMFFSMGNFEVRVLCWLGQGGQEVEVVNQQSSDTLSPVSSASQSSSSASESGGLSPSPSGRVRSTASHSSAGLDDDLRRMRVEHGRPLRRRQPTELMMATSLADIVDMSSEV